MNKEQPDYIILQVRCG